MTKRDVAVWFCKVIAVVGMGNGVFILLRILVAPEATKNWGTVAFASPSSAMYLFVYLFAQGIGTELAAEGEFGPPVTSKSDLGALLLRCAGLSLLLGATLTFTFAAVQLASLRFQPSAATMPAIIISQWKAQAVSSLLQAVVGFFLAFGPRIRAAMQPKSLSQ